MPSIIGYSPIAFAAAPIGGYNPGETLDPDCAPGDTDCVVATNTGGSSQWDDVTGGINYAGGNVGIRTTTPDALLKIVGQNPNNWVSLLGGDSSINYNSFEIRLEDNSSDQFGRIGIYASPEESFILTGSKLDGSASGNFRLGTHGITTIDSSDDIGNSNFIEISQSSSSFTIANSVENFLFQLHPNVARFAPSTNSRSGVSIGNLGIMSADEAGLYDAGGDVPLAIYDAINNRVYYTRFMFVDYNAPVISMGDPFSSIGGVLVNYADGAINIGRAETTAADGIEGIQVYQNGDNPVVRLGSSAFVGNGTLLTINDMDQQFQMNNGNLYVQNLGDGIILADGYLSTMRAGIYSLNGDQTIADYDSQNNLYNYANGLLSVDYTNNITAIGTENVMINGVLVIYGQILKQEEQDMCYLITAVGCCHGKV